jgi:hypothetical protein
VPDRRKQAALLGLAAFGIVAAGLLAEACLRVAAPVPLSSSSFTNYVSAEDLWVLRPNAVTQVKLREFRYRVETNSLGLRGPEIAPPPAPGGQRILLLGDSFTFGWGVDDPQTYGRVLERRLTARRPGQAVEVLNAGVPAYSTRNEWAFFSDRGVKLRPTLVVLQLLIDDDVMDNLKPRHAVVEGALVSREAAEWARAVLPPGRPLTLAAVEMAQKARQPPGAPYERIKAALQRHSHLYRAMVDRVPDIVAASVRAVFGPLGLAAPQDDAARLSRAQIQVFLTRRDAQVEEAVRLTEAYLLRIKQLADAHETRFAVAIFPTLFEVDRIRRERVLRRLGLRDGEVDVAALRTRFLEFGRQHDVPVLDLRPAIDAAIERGESLYCPIDGHFNARGYERAGEMVAEFVLGAELLESGPPRRAR